MCSIDLTYGIEGWGEIVPVQGNGKVSSETSSFSFHHFSCY